MVCAAADSAIVCEFFNFRNISPRFASIHVVHSVLNPRRVVFDFHALGFYGAGGENDGAAFAGRADVLVECLYFAVEAVGFLPVVILSTAYGLRHTIPIHVVLLLW